MKQKSAQPKLRTEKRTTPIAATQLSPITRDSENRECIFTEKSTSPVIGSIQLCRIFSLSQEKRKNKMFGDNMQKKQRILKNFRELSALAGDFL